MNIVLTTLNAKYTHHNLALRYLSSYCKDDFPDLITREFNINQQLELILSELVDLQPDVIGFSCYIWNIEQTLELISNLRKVIPDLVILLGGPEVSFEYQNLMKEHQQIDYIIRGEGEEPFKQLLLALQSNFQLDQKQLASIPSLVYRDGNGIKNNDTMVMDLTKVPGAFKGTVDDLENKIVYYETSRGCPFGCEYCLSSRTGKVRYFPMAQCKQELGELAKLGIQQIRFVDRTFNCDHDRALELVEYMLSLDTKTRFQLEIGGDLLTEEMLQLLEKAPVNRFQFEIGVQSTNKVTLSQIGRFTNLAKLADNATALRNRTNVRFLLDLIAGLPAESYTRFGESFDFVYNLHPTKIQLGFLKLLKGSRLRDRVQEFGCIYTERAPYEVLQTDSISYSELASLKNIESLVDIYYNSGRFSFSIDYLIVRDGITPFQFFETLATKWKSKRYHLVSHSVFSLYEYLWKLMGNEDPILLDYLKFDFRKNEQKRVTPIWLGGKKTNRFERGLVRTDAIFKYLPELADLALSPRELTKFFMVEQFDHLIYPWEPKPKQKNQLLLFYYRNFPQVAVFNLDPSDVGDVDDL